MEATELPSRYRFLAFGILLLAAILLFARAVDRDLNHDEHQFLTPGALLARQGAQPYRDYPLFHLPNLVFVYAAIDRYTHQLVLGAKIASCLGSLAALAVILFRSARRIPFAAPAWIIPSLLSVTALLVFDPLFLWTAGKTWNHELPTGAVILSFAALVASLRRDSLWLGVLSGALISFGIGCRLTLLPLAIPLFAAFGLFPDLTSRRRISLLLAFLGGTTIAAIPTLYYLAKSTDAFFFGNLEFPRLRLTDATDLRAAETATWWRKVRYFFKEVVLLDRQKDGQFRGSLLLFLSFTLISISPAWTWLRARFTASSAPSREGFAGTLAALLVPFAILGCALPTRYQYQHWFAVAPILALAISEGLATASPGRRHWKPIALAALAIVAIATGISRYAESLAGLTKPATWFSTKLRAQGAEIASHLPQGPVLTLGPTWVLEAGLSTYPEFATGPFAWRLAHLLPVEKRRRFHVVAPTDLAAFLAEHPPAAILTGMEEDELEQPLIDYAANHGFTRVKLSKKRELWLQPRKP